MKFKEFRYFCGMFIGVVSLVGYLKYTDEKNTKDLMKKLEKDAKHISSDWKEI